MRDHRPRRRATSAMDNLEDPLSLPKCFDAAYPPAIPLLGAAAVLGYIGNHRTDEDRHIWTVKEWQPFAHLRQFPVWELNTAYDAKQAATQVVADMKALGWSDGRAVVGAMETTIAPEWWEVFEATVEGLQMVPVCYGSQNFVFGNDAKRYWVAHYDGIPELGSDPQVWAKQYLSTGAVDWSVVSYELLRHGGEGPRQ